MMQTNQYLVDSNFLYAIFDKDADEYPQAYQFVTLPDRRFLIPEVVLTETAYLFRRLKPKALGTVRVIQFLTELLSSDPIIICLQKEDYIRTREIMLRYTDSYLDFVDCALMALSERLDIGNVCTFDRRDFSIYRRPNGDALELYPQS